MANFDTLKAAIRADIYENTEQAITGEVLQTILLAVVDDINIAKQDFINLDSGLDWNEDGELSVDFTSVQHAFAPQAPLAWNSDHLILQLGAGLFIDSSEQLAVKLGDGLILTIDGQLTINLGDGLMLDSDTGELGVDFTSVQEVIPDLDTIRSGAAAGATAYQRPADGIPANDLDPAVQGDLGLAGSALQPSVIVTSIDADSTDDEVPSAKCVYDMVGDIATLLAQI